MGYHGQGFILPSYERAKELSQSVRPVDRMEWEERISMGLRIENSFRDLQIILLRVEEMKRDLLRTLTEIQEFENLEVLLNETSLVLGGYDYLFNDEGLMGQFKLISPRPPRFSQGFSLGITGSDSLTEKARKEQEELREQIRTYLCYERAVLNVVQEFRPEIPEYLDYLKENHKKLETPLSLPLRFKGTQDDSDGIIKNRIPFPALIDLLEDFSVRVSEISIEDEESSKIISDFEKTI